MLSLMCITGAQKEGKPNHEGTFKAFAHVTSLNLPSAKSSQMAKANINGRRKYVPPTAEGTTNFKAKDVDPTTGKKRNENNNPLSK